MHDEDIINKKFEELPYNLKGMEILILKNIPLGLKWKNLLEDQDISF